MPNIYLPGYDNKVCFFFALGRNAIYAVCRMLKLKPGDEILTPAFDCDGTLQPFRVLGLNLEFFHSCPYTFTADLRDIKKRISRKTKLIHIINYFGMPQPWDELAAIGRESGIPVLEDNAYSLFSKISQSCFGTFGDFAVFSLRKNLPLLNGGMLKINNPKYRLNLPAQKTRYFYMAEKPGIVNLLKDKLGWDILPRPVKTVVRKFRPPVYAPPPLYSAKEGYPHCPERDIIGKEFSLNYLRPMSGLAQAQLSCFKKEDYLDIIQKKRYYYNILSKKLADTKGIKILWENLPDGLAPFCFSFLAGKNRDSLLVKMQDKYDVMAWPTLSRQILDRIKEFPEVELLGKELFQINLASHKIRQRGFAKHLDSLIEDIRAYEFQL